MPVPIIPKVYQEFPIEGSFVFENESIANNKAFPITIEYLCDFLHLDVKSKGRISLEKVEGMEEEEYSLKITEERIIIKASFDKGAFYGSVSLRQLLPREVEKAGIKNGMNVSATEINDKPEFKYRGFMFDVARHFFDKNEIKRMIDLISLYKFNALHLHLSDDQGFRLDIKKYPLLKEISTKRSGSEYQGAFLKNTIKVDKIVHEGYYTETDIKEIVDYASKRFVEVIPEIDVPGHIQAVLAAYREYSCLNQKIDVRKEWGISKEVLCIGNEDAILFAVDLIREVKKLFPSSSFHIGGDECPTTRYKKCPKCLKLMEEENIKDVKDLQNYFTDRLSFILSKEGMNIRVWNEALNPSLSDNVTVQYWISKNKNEVLEAIKKGTKVIASPFQKYYLDYTYPLFSLEETYEYNPYFDELEGEAKENIIGVETPIWTEWVADRKRLDFQVFPRAIAVAESGWTAPKEKNYNDFLYRLDSSLKRLDIIDVNYAPKECYLQKTSSRLWKSFLNKDHPSNLEYKKWNKR
ncbi:MAG: beta-N-acetylhexosaminidase [Bacillales bacterium]|nr:beta-N-acetylhexosaminidase [Bacillales bacterium]